MPVSTVDVLTYVWDHVISYSPATRSVRTAQLASWPGAAVLRDVDALEPGKLCLPLFLGLDLRLAVVLENGVSLVILVYS